MQYLKDLKDNWNDTEDFHRFVHETFCDLVEANPVLKDHRHFVQHKVWGFGEKSFWWLWKLVLQELPKNPRLLEIGIYKGGTLSIWKLLRPDAQVYGITPLNNSDGHIESDYAADIAHIHDLYGLEQPQIIKQYSQSKEAIVSAKNNEPYDVVYIDGGHSYDDAFTDLINYSPMIKVGGYLAIDDAANEMNMPWGFFQGIDTVTEAKLSWLKTDIAQDFEFVGNVVHLVIYKRVK